MSTTIYTDKKVADLQNFWNCIHFHPTDAIEDEWGQRILNHVADDGAAYFVRMYTMMEDIVSMDADGNLQYDFTLNDQRIDYMVEKGFRILLDYNFIPPCIAEKPDVQSSMSKNKTRYKGKMIVTSAPKDYALWEEICFRYTEHILARYGEETVAGWYLQCFNEPDIPAFFLGDLPDTAENAGIRCREYCKLYSGFANGIRKAGGKLRIGGPALAYRADFMEGFLDYTSRNGLQLDYVCFHTYGPSPTEVNQGVGRITPENNLARLEQMYAIIKRFYPQGMEVLVDEWGAMTHGFFNRDECPRLIFRETQTLAVYFGKLVTMLIEKKMSPSKLLICLSGQHEMTEDFSGFRNLFTLHGIAKPIYNAYCLMRHLGPEQLAAETDRENLSILATANGERRQVLLTYASEFFDETLPTLHETIRLAGLQGEKTVTVYRIDGTHLNPYHVYCRERYSKDLTQQQLARLLEEGTLKPAAQFQAGETFTLQIPSDSFILLEF